MDLTGIPWAELGVGVAALLVLSLVVGGLIRGGITVLRLFVKHAEGITEAQVETAKAMASLTEATEGLKEEVREMRRENLAFHTEGARRARAR